LSAGAKAARWADPWAAYSVEMTAAPRAASRAACWAALRVAPKVGSGETLAASTVAQRAGPRAAC
jgi:hypothetical protein